MIYLLLIVLGVSIQSEVKINNLEADPIIIQPSCFGIDDAVITVKVKMGTPPYSFNWTSNNGLSSQADTIFSLGPGLYTVQIIDGASCILTINNIEVKYPNPLNINFINENVKCLGEKNGCIEAIVSGGNAPYQYSIDGGDNFQFSNKFLGLGKGNYRIIVKDKNNCTLEAFSSIEEDEGGLLNLIADTTVFFNQSLFLDPIIQINATSLMYEWTGSDLSYLSCNDCPNPFIGPINKPLNYTLTVIDNFGCVYQAFVQINLIKYNYINVPTAFTPNGDGENDLLNIFGSSNSIIKEIRIYDKYGLETYFEKEIAINNRSIGWDGRTKTGEMALPGTYMWVMEVSYQDQSISKETGVTTLIR